MNKYNSKYFFTEPEKKRIEETIRDVEKQSSGEIVVKVVNESEKYKESIVFGAILLSILFSVLIQFFMTDLIQIFSNIFKISQDLIFNTLISLPFQLKDEFRYIVMYGIFIFIPLIIILYVVFFVMLSKIKFLKRIFLTNKQSEYEVRERALTSFFEHRLYNTKDETGILFLISLLEKKVFVLADKGIYEKIKQETLDNYAKNISKGIKEKRPAEALAGTIIECGKILKEFFPVKKDDKDELSNKVIIE